VNRRPRVSVITPTYNTSRFVRETIASVRRQTFSEWEMVIVDDCSTDATYEVVDAEAKREPRIRHARMPVNSGSGLTRNRALELAAGRYIAFLDSDDLWDPEKLDRQLAFMRNADRAFTFTGYRVIDEDGTPLGSAGPVMPIMGYSQMVTRNVGCLTVMIDREKVPEVRFANYRRNQDGALWLSIIRSGHRAYGLNEELSSYRVVKTSATAKKWRSAAAVWAVLRDQEKLSVPVASWYFAQYAVFGMAKHLATRAKQR
jgi:teichuronic acid biosynthesis glycosyltransferase TuaG